MTRTYWILKTLGVLVHQVDVLVQVEWVVSRFDGLIELEEEENWIGVDLSLASERGVLSNGDCLVLEQLGDYQLGQDI